MINLLPPEVKSQLRFGQYNARAVRYLWLVIIVIVLIGGTLAGTYYYLSLSINQANTQLSQKSTVIDHFHGLENQVTALNAQTTAIKSIQQSQAKFSVLLSDLASITPKGVFINSLTLTGDASKPVLVVITADNLSHAVAFRDAVVTLSRVAAADINIVTTSNTGVTANVTLAFKPGGAH